ncbi:host-nuclease inhibitor Gam family protein [Candidatus Persebacteraceae bacterium Df01]|jgi:hypothetical protein|uniref:Host-nuclease inhibitor Gam family protein n=1 Tax=Candidatus Doriopsillibacter californiensis TaxID=2970740 RepID=A0ABT7QM97_9GAMM|nr:host-nuclease inhibitor Gam family protein [Candidatus Persebacteraceae bacterium Df01]
MNHEHHINQLAEAHNQNIIALATLGSKIEAAEAKVREAKKTDLDKLLRAEIETRVALYNAIVDSDPSLWQSKKTRSVGAIKYGLQKERTTINIPDEIATIAKLREIYGIDAKRFINIIEKIKKTAVHDLPDDEAKSAGIKVQLGDENAIFVKTTITLPNVIKQIMADGWTDSENA